MFRSARIFAIVLAFVAVGAALAQSPPSTKIRTTYEAGELALRRGDLDEAEKAFRRVLAEAPSDPGARANLGVVYMRRKEWDRAIGEFRAAAKLAPQVAGIRLNIGLTDYRQGAYQEAIPEFEAVVREEPQSTQARQLLGLCYLFTERYAEAAGALDSVWTPANGDLSCLCALSVAAGKAGRTSRTMSPRVKRFEALGGDGQAKFSGTEAGKKKFAAAIGISFCETPRSTLANVTSAFGITAPETSRTVPDLEALFCATTAAHARKRNATNFLPHEVMRRPFSNCCV